MTQKFDELRGHIDAVLGLTETRLAFENKICALFGKNDYFQATKKEQKIIKEISSFVLGREISIIEKTIEYLGEKKWKK